MTDHSAGIELASVHNFRDVAGPGYSLVGGGVMRRGVVFRSTALTVGEEDLELLERAGVSCVVDLRTEAEIAGQPDVVPAGADYLAIDVLAGNTTAATYQNFPTMVADDARREMELTYDRFVVGDEERAAFGRAFRALAGSSGPAIVHCTAGKDRTGWVSAVLQSLAGVGADDVMADYLLTNERSAGFVERARAFVEAEMPDQLPVIDVLLRVRPEYLGRSLEAMERDFGDARRYLVEGTGLEEAVVDDLAGRLRAEVSTGA